MLKKLAIYVAVLMIAALISIPAFAQTVDLGLEWGSEGWLIGQFGDETGDLTEFCLAAGEDAAGWTAQFPELAPLCGWTVEEPVEESSETTEESVVE